MGPPFVDPDDVGVQPDDPAPCLDLVLDRVPHHAGPAARVVELLDERLDRLFGVEVLLTVLIERFDGMISNDKFCCTRWGVLQLSWWRRPNRLRR